MPILEHKILSIIFCAKLECLHRITNKNICMFFLLDQIEIHILLFGFIFQFKGFNKSVLLPLTCLIFLVFVSEL